MTAITINELEATLRNKLYAKAAQHGRSVEQEAKSILAAALSTDAVPDGYTLVQDIRARVEPLGGIELELPPRDKTMRPLPEL